MSLDHHSGNPSGNAQWDNATGRGLPAIPPPEREEASSWTQAASPEPQPHGSSVAERSSVAEWLGWSPTSWRARDTR
jgi:hypothetical protein